MCKLLNSHTCPWNRETVHNENLTQENCSVKKKKKKKKKQENHLEILKVKKIFLKKKKKKKKKQENLLEIFNVQKLFLKNQKKNFWADPELWNFWTQDVLFA